MPKDNDAEQSPCFFLFPLKSVAAGTLPYWLKNRISFLAFDLVKRERRSEKNTTFQIKFTFNINTIFAQRPIVDDLRFEILDDQSDKLAVLTFRSGRPGLLQEKRVHGCEGSAALL